MKRIFVYGWYGHGNVGDEAMRVAIQTAIGDKVSLTFGDRVPTEPYDAIWFGGGSFLDQRIQGNKDFHCPVAYIGIGVGSKIHDDHLALLPEAEFVIVRDWLSFNNIRSQVAAEDLFCAPDLVFSLTEALRFPGARPGSDVAVFLSDHFTPRQQSPVWMYQAQQWFSRELAKALDTIWTSEGQRSVFYPMCVNRWENDCFAAAQVLGLMETRSRSTLVYKDGYDSDLGLADLQWIAAAVQTSSVVITQRLHAAVFAVMYDVPCILINGHDKMTGFVKTFPNTFSVPYYGFTDKCLLDVKTDSIKGNTTTTSSGLQSSWQDLWPVVTERFAL